MKTPKIPKSKSKPPKSALLPDPETKPKGVIIEPDLNHTNEFEAELKKSDPEIQLYIDALKVENLKFQKQLAKCRAEKDSLLNQITILTEEYAQYRHDNPPFDPSTASEEIKRLEKERQELEAKLQELEAKEIETTEQSHPAESQ